jgi:hypothetical protein
MDAGKRKKALQESKNLERLYILNSVYAKKNNPAA